MTDTAAPLAEKIRTRLAEAWAELDANDPVFLDQVAHEAAFAIAPDVERLTTERDQARSAARGHELNALALLGKVGRARFLLGSILGQFVEKGHPGRPCLRTGWINETTVADWRAAVEALGAAAPPDEPPATEGTSEPRTAAVDAHSPESGSVPAESDERCGLEWVGGLHDEEHLCRRPVGHDPYMHECLCGTVRFIDDERTDASGETP